MASKKLMEVTARQVKPIISIDQEETRKRVISLYKAWHRQIPYIVRDYDIPKTVPQCRAKLREEFDKHKNIQDIRVIDMLVIKGQMELQETVKMWKTSHIVMAFWKDTVEPKPKDFLGKFLEGHN